jgi:hypothetical protein
VPAATGGATLRAFSLILLLLACTGCGESVRYISQSGGGAFEAALAATDSGFLAAWHDVRDGNAEIYIRQLDAQGQPAGPERRLTDDREASSEPEIAPIGANVAVAWYDKASDGAVRPRLGVWSTDGRQRWTVVLAPRGRNAVVRARDRELFTAWIQDDTDTGSSVWGQWWTLDGKAVDAAVKLAPAGRTTSNLNAAVDRYGRAWVVFDATGATTSEELFVVRAGSAPVQLTADDGKASTYPDIAISGSRVAIAWTDERDGNKEAYVSVVISDDVADRFEARAKRLTETRGETIGTYLAWNGPLLGLTYSDDTEGQHEIYFQFLDVGGRTLGAAERITDTSRQSLIPTVQAWGEGFALAWSEYQGAEDGHGVTAYSDIAFRILQ